MLTRPDKEAPRLVRDSAVLKPLWKTAHGGQNQIVVTNGLGQTGKSMLDLAMAVALDPEFEIETHQAYTQVDFQKINEKNDYLGAVNTWEEAGLAEFGANAREFWSEGNRDLSTLFQAMGFSHQIALINLPLKLMLDKHLRSLCHLIIETIRIKKWKNRCIARAWQIEQVTDKAAPFKRYPRYVTDEAVWRIKSFSVPLPEKHLVEEYLYRSNLFKSTLKEYLWSKGQVKAEGGGNGGEDKSSRKDEIDALISLIEAEPIKYSKEVGRGNTKKLKLDTTAVMDEFNVGVERARYIIGAFRRRYGSEVRIS